MYRCTSHTSSRNAQMKTLTTVSANAISCIPRGEPEIGNAHSVYVYMCLYIDVCVDMIKNIYIHVVEKCATENADHSKFKHECMRTKLGTHPACINACTCVRLRLWCTDTIELTQFDEKCETEDADHSELQNECMRTNLGRALLICIYKHVNVRMCRMFTMKKAHVVEKCSTEDADYSKSGYRIHHKSEFTHLRTHTYVYKGRFPDSYA